MFDKFSDYMQYLLPTAFKRQKKQNQLLIYCKVIGRLYDSLLQLILRLREEAILETCDSRMLEVFGNDYEMPQMRGETLEMYRRRLQMKALTAAAAGTQKGILYAMESVGYPNCTITPFYLTDPDRWAEIRIDVFAESVDVDNPIAYGSVVAEVMKVKKASTLPHWRFYYPIKIWETDINYINAAIRFIVFIPFWGDYIYTGPYCYDGTLLYNAVRKYKIGLLIRYLMHTKTQQYVAYRYNRIKTFIQGREYTNLSLCSFYSISFWGCSVYNGQACYDGTLLYNAVRNYKVCIIVRNYIGIFTLQRIVCNRNCTKVLIQNRMQTDVLLYFLYRIKQRESILKVATQYLIKLNVVEEINHNSQILSMQVLHKNILNIWHRYKGKVKNNRPKVVDKVKIQMDINSPCGQIGNMQIITSRNVAYYDGTLRYDGTARYDALYEEERVE
ncbi:MAG: hypothetical protein OSJ73_10495 [Lachnospiraceae bacterium]|nr:hypothetical protein [Lachnospiraceae bacterium]